MRGIWVIIIGLAFFVGTITTGIVFADKAPKTLAEECAKKLDDKRRKNLDGLFCLAIQSLKTQFDELFVQTDLTKPVLFLKVDPDSQAPALVVNDGTNDLFTVNKDGSIQIGSNTVTVNPDGTVTGGPLHLLAGSTVNDELISTEPDQDTLGTLSCSQEQLAQFNGDSWECSDPPTIFTSRIVDVGASFTTSRTDVLNILTENGGKPPTPDYETSPISASDIPSGDASVSNDEYMVVLELLHAAKTRINGVSIQFTKNGADFGPVGGSSGTQFTSPKSSLLIVSDDDVSIGDVYGVKIWDNSVVAGSDGFIIKEFSVHVVPRTMTLGSITILDNFLDVKTGTATFTPQDTTLVYSAIIDGIALRHVPNTATNLGVLGTPSGNYSPYATGTELLIEGESKQFLFQKSNPSLSFGTMVLLS